MIDLPSIIQQQAAAEAGDVAASSVKMLERAIADGDDAPEVVVNVKVCVGMYGGIYRIERKATATRTIREKSAGESFEINPNQPELWETEK